MGMFVQYTVQCTLALYLVLLGHRDLSAVHVLLLHRVLRRVGERGGDRLPNLLALGRSGPQGDNPLT